MKVLIYLYTETYLYKKKEYQKSVDAYKNALKNNSKDEDTRYNLAYAQKKLEEQNKKNNDAKIAELIKEYEVEAFKIRDELNKKLKDKQKIHD